MIWASFHIRMHPLMRVLAPLLHSTYQYSGSVWRLMTYRSWSRICTKYSEYLMVCYLVLVIIRSCSCGIGYAGYIPKTHKTSHYSIPRNRIEFAFYLLDHVIPYFPYFLKLRIYACFILLYHYHVYRYPLSVPECSYKHDACSYN